MNIDANNFTKRLIGYLKYFRGKRVANVTKQDILYALSLTLKEHIIEQLFETEERYKKHDVKRLYYISIEYMVGNLLKNNIINLQLNELCKNTVSNIGYNLDNILDLENEPALGTGGLGRLAACFLDSLASMEMPGFGYGINYEFGSLKQIIENGYQEEKPDDWSRDRSPWLMERPDEIIRVPVYGHLEKIKDPNGCNRGVWKSFRYIEGMPSDLPIVGYNGRTVNYLRLYTAQASTKLNFEKFYFGEFKAALAQKIYAENISKLVYPSDTNEKGRELRLLQEYFLVSCSIQDIVRKFEASYSSYDVFPQKVAIQINDTHPALAIAELMRILLDEKYMQWERAWEITNKTIAYTNHTLLPEALEKWPVYLVGRILPRHLDIISKINKHFLQKVDTIWNGNVEKLRSMSIFEESEAQYIRMANLSIIGSHSINGVSHIHSELVKSKLMPDFYQLWPDKFNNKTNGITQRRWLLSANPELAKFITSKIGDGWIKDLSTLREMEPYARDENCQERINEIKMKNKGNLADYINKALGMPVILDSIFDIQVKRIHEYKRQLLNVLNIINIYLRIIEDGEEPPIPRTFIFAGKSAPSYYTAKLIIKLINNVSKTINKDNRAKDLLNVVFIPDYNVSLAEKIIPAADVSEHISTASMEASGTGNMKFALNGAVIIGTLDGANIEIRDEVGEDNIYIFGRNASEINKMKSERSYYPLTYYESNDFIKRVVDTLSSNLFCPDEPGLFKPLYDALIHHGDRYFVLADFDSYTDTQIKISDDFMNRPLWLEKVLLNISRMGKFSSDRTIREYAEDIWKIKPVTD